MSRGPRVEGGERGALVGGLPLLVEDHALPRRLPADLADGVPDRPATPGGDRGFHVALSSGEQGGERSSGRGLAVEDAGEGELEEGALALPDVAAASDERTGETVEIEVDRIGEGAEAGEGDAVKAHRIRARFPCHRPCSSAQPLEIPRAARSMAGAMATRRCWVSSANATGSPPWSGWTGSTRARYARPISSTVASGARPSAVKAAAMKSVSRLARTLAPLL